MEQNHVSADQPLSPARLIAVAHDVLRQWYLIAAVALIAAMGAFVLQDLRYVPQ